MASIHHPRPPPAPSDFDVEAWFARMDSHGDEPFLPDGVEDPPLLEAENIFDDDEPGGVPEYNMQDEDEGDGSE